MNVSSSPSALTKDLCVARDSQVHRTAEALPLNNNLIWLQIAKRGMGKTTNMLNALFGRYKGQFDTIWLVSTTCRGDPKMSELVSILDAGGQVFDTLNESTLGEVIDRIKAFNAEVAEDNERAADPKAELPFSSGLEVKLKPRRRAKAARRKKRPEPRHLIILDDVLHLLPSSSKGGVNLLFSANRHLKTSVWLACQKFNACSTLTRSSADMLTLFRVDNRQEYMTIRDDMNIDPQTFDAIYDHVFKGPDGDEPGMFLHISWMAGKPTFYKRYDPITIHRAE